MLFGVVVWVALAVFVPTVVVPTVQHAVQPSGTQAAPDARPAGAPAVLPASGQSHEDG
ncbi:TPA: hypothetical protein QDB05_004364 [Burkholderia vietnamiensis]|nr:hypothetical protein [Burkholderia vietnamiensis]